MLAAFVEPSMLDEAIAEARGLVRAVGIVRASGRFANLITAMTDDLTAHRDDRQWAAFPAHSELRHVVRVFERWRHHAVGGDVVREALTEPRTYAHHVVLLAAATYLQSAGNDVQLLAPQPPSQTPDLAIRVNGANSYVEVKTRDELVDPSAVLDAAAATNVVQRCLHRSASQQLRAAGTGLLAAGGLRVPIASLDALKLAAPAELARRPERSHIAGAIFFTVGARLEDVPVSVQPTPAQVDRMGVHERFATRVNPRLFMAEVACRGAVNPRYDGGVRLLQPGEHDLGLYLPYAAAH